MAEQLTLGALLRRAVQDLQSGGKEDRYAARTLHNILCERADACERLARAADEYDKQAMEDDRVAVQRTWKEHREALAAYRKEVGRG